jgi:ferredoxin
MLVSKLKPIEEILKFLNGEKKIFLLGCKGCAEACKTGGFEQVKMMKKELEKENLKVSGSCVIDFLCDKALVKLRLSNYAKNINESDSVLVMSCGIGVQCVSKVINKVCHPACNTISLGGRQGEWRSEERCRECGDCILDKTGGICPLTSCTKGLLNGGCGGAKDGKCEFEPDVRDCGWNLIYERLKKLNRLEKMKEIILLKKYLKMQPPKEIREDIIWKLEK